MQFHGPAVPFNSHRPVAFELALLGIQRWQRKLVGDVAQNHFTRSGLFLHFGNLVRGQIERVSFVKAQFSSMDADAGLKWILANGGQMKRAIELHVPLNYIWKVIEGEQHSIAYWLQETT